MKGVLLVECSPRDAHSVSRQAAAQLVLRLGHRAPGLRVVRRDLVAEPPPPVDRAFTEAMRVPAARRTGAQHHALRHSERLIAELEATDLLVIATPMHNFTVPAPLKAWIDQVVRVDRTFQTTPAGKLGRLADRPAYILISAGGFMTGAQARQPDFLTPYLCAILATIGIHSTRFLCLEATTRCADWPARTQAWIDGLHLPS